MNTEKKAFEKMMREFLKGYFRNNMDCLLRANMRIEDDGSIIRIYKKRSEDNFYRYDVGIIY